ncbi:helix-turn-helix transcriptional regulator [Streptomyces sp. NPDC001034]|uniref:helix-turn-helix domain-containing protein n=1 Tax=Streptomyces sp. NPDC001034 TaxID=3154375 RepID=UPI00331BA4D6
MASLKFSPTSLRRVRRERGLGLRTLAAQVGCRHTTIGHYETGYRVPSTPRLAELAHALATPMDTFFEVAE